MMIRPPTASIGDRKCLRADLFQLPQEHKPLASTSGVGHRRDRGGLDGATTFISSSRGLRRHAAWRASMTRVANKLVSPDKRGVDDERRAARAKWTSLTRVFLLC